MGGNPIQSATATNQFPACTHGAIRQLALGGDGLSTDGTREVAVVSGGERVVVVRLRVLVYDWSEQTSRGAVPCGSLWQSTEGLVVRL